MVQRYDAGEWEVEETIILSLIRPVISIARKFKIHKPFDVEDLIGIAMLALVQTVKLFLDSAVDRSNIVAYTLSTIKSKMKNAAGEARLIRIPSSTFYRKMLAKQEGFNDLEVVVLSLFDHEIARTPWNETDFNEIIEKVFSDPKDRKLLEYRIDGLTDSEIATKFDTTQQTVQRRRSFLVGRLQEELYL